VFARTSSIKTDLGTERTSKEDSTTIPLDYRPPIYLLACPKQSERGVIWEELVFNFSNLSVVKGRIFIL